MWILSKEMKLYKLGLVIGRFQPLHNGHVAMIRHALELCEKVVVYVGSAQESCTKLNPFSYCGREEMLAKTFDTEYLTKRLLVRPLPDIGVGNNSEWGGYIIKKFKSEFHCEPDLYVSGCELDRVSWFSGNIAPKMDELRLNRSIIHASGTICRELLLKDDKDAFFQHVPIQLFDKYDIYKNIACNVKEEK